MTPTLRVAILYWTDPWQAVAAGGIDSYIGGFLRYAPPEVAVEIIGVTSDRRARPVGRWLDLPLGDRTVRFFALFAPRTLSRQRVPLSLRYAAWLLWHRVRLHASIALAHRPEPALLAPPVKAVVLVHHTGPSDIPSGSLDSRWSTRRIHAWLERMAVRRARRIYAVSQRALAHYRASYPGAAAKTRFFPTFFDPAVFTLPSAADRAIARAALRAALGLPGNATIAVSVGRLDHQKDHLLSIAAFALLREQYEQLFLVIIGDGPLRSRIEANVFAADMQTRILLLGEKTAADIAATHHGADLFVLASAYEGMSIALLEAQACGLPVVAPHVGESHRTVRDGLGQIAVRTPRGLADAVATSLDTRDRFVPEHAARAAAEYSAASVVPALCRDLLDLA